MTQLQQLLTTYQPYDETEAAMAKQLQQFLAHGWKPYERSNLVAHVIAEAWIVNPARTHVVLHQNASHGLWSTPGGHCDGSPDVYAVALREAEEESGLTGLKPLLAGNLYDVNTGHVTQRRKPAGIEPPHLHFDICFAFEAPDNATLRISEESTKLEWVPLSSITEQQTFPGYNRRITKTLAGILS